MTLPQSLPRSFRDLDFSFREGTFKTALAANFRGVDIPTIFLDVLPWSHEEIPQKFFRRGCVECVMGIYGFGFGVRVLHGFALGCYLEIIYPSSTRMSFSFSSLTS